MKRVSVLIPAHNAAPWVGQAIESALNQSWPNLEVIVIDDGSKDETLRIAQFYAGTRLRAIWQPNSGASAARNHALRVSTGDVIQYLDADDILAPNKIELQMAILGQSPGYLCSGEWGSFFSFIENAFFSPPNQLHQDLAPIAWLIEAWGNGLMMQPGAWLLDRDLALAAGPWDEELSMDDDGEYFTRVVLKSRGVKFCPGARVYYRIGNTQSLSFKGSPKSRKSHYLATVRSIQHLLSAEDSPRTRAAAARKLMDYMFMTYPHSPYFVRAAEAKIKELGVDVPPPHGGQIFNKLSKVIGWRAAKQLQFPYYVAKLQLKKILDASP